MQTPTTPPSPATSLTALLNQRKLFGSGAFKPQLFAVKSLTSPSSGNHEPRPTSGSPGHSSVSSMSPVPPTPSCSPAQSASPASFASSSSSPSFASPPSLGSVHMVGPMSVFISPDGDPWLRTGPSDSPHPGSRPVSTPFLSSQSSSSTSTSQHHQHPRQPFVVKAPYGSLSPPRERGGSGGGGGLLAPGSPLAPALVDDPVEAALFLDEQQRREQSLLNTRQFKEELQTGAIRIRSEHLSQRECIDREEQIRKELLFKQLEKSRGELHRQLHQQQETQQIVHQRNKEVGDAMKLRQDEEIRRRQEILRQKQLELQRQQEIVRQEQQRVLREKQEAEAAAKALALQKEKEKREQESRRAAASQTPPPHLAAGAPGKITAAHPSKSPSSASASASASGGATSGPWREISGLYLDEHAEIVAFQKELDDAKASHDKKMPMAQKREVARTLTLVLNTLSASQGSVRLKIGETRELFKRCEQSGKLAGRYARRILVKKALAQVDRLALHSDNIAPVFPLACLARELCNGDAVTARVFQAELARACPYTVPAYLSREGGARRQGSGAIEVDTAFFNRMEGYTVFFMAVCQYPSRPSSPPQQLFDLPHAWCWFARLLNTYPARISPVILRGALKSGGYQMHRAFGPNFDKLMRLAYQDYTALMERCEQPLIPEISNVKTLIEVAQRARSFPKPAGYDLPS